MLKHFNGLYVFNVLMKIMLQDNFDRNNIRNKCSNFRITNVL